MKYTIEGFSQEYALTLTKQVEEKGKMKTVKVDCIDLIILRWFVDFYNTQKMIKVEIEGAQYAWVNYSKILDDIPLLDIGKHMLANRLQKLCEFGILTHKNIKCGGNFSYYGFGANYHNLIEKPCATDEHLVQENAEPCAINCTTLVQNNAEPCAINCNTNNSSTKDPSTKDPSTKERGTATSRFIPPTAREVHDYCQEKGYHINVEKYISFYESIGWKVGKNKMKDWKAAVRTWVQRDKEYNQKQEQANDDVYLEDYFKDVTVPMD